MLYHLFNLEVYADDWFLVGLWCCIHAWIVAQVILYNNIDIVKTLIIELVDKKKNAPLRALGKETWLILSVLSGAYGKICDLILKPKVK